MPTQYLIMNSLGQAQAQSKTYWEKILGRTKYPQDTTEFMSLCEENPLDNKGIIIIEQPEYDRLYPLLTPQEKAFADANLKLASDPYIAAFLDAIKRQNPNPDAL
jgi:hypothetical protein